MRCRFNRGGFVGRIESGEFTLNYLNNSHPDPSPPGHPWCTRTQMIQFIDSDDNEIVRVHQYLLPDGTIGGSGKRDPIRVLQKGTLYRLQKGAKDAPYLPPLVRTWRKIRCFLLGR